MITCFRIWYGVTVFACFAAVFTAALCRARASESIDTLPNSGQALYARACAACHGADGTGSPSNQVGFNVPLPDFTDCNFAPREANIDWIQVTSEGGPARAFSRMMPAFGDALSTAQIEKILHHIRTFCSEPDLPRGELNLPRALVTTKAYPEDELILTTAVITEGPDSIKNELIYEQRFGARNQFELILPFGWNRQESGPNGDTEWKSNLGDIGFGLKRVLYHSLESGSILTAGGEIFLPTGDEDEGFGSGTTLFEPYLSYGRILPASFFAQLQVGIVLPYDDDQTQEEAFWRGSAGRTFYLGSYGRGWSPMLEILGSRELVSGADTRWDAVPQLQVALNRRQHVRLCAGTRFPLNDRDDRETVYIAYLLWDWFDGGFFEGW